MRVTIPAAMAAMMAAMPALGQEGPAGPPAESVFDDTWVSIGVGAGYGPSYDGSDDYVFFPTPIVQGQVAGIGIQPRPAGIALDLVPDPDDAIGFALGPVARYRSDRSRQIKDPVVAAAGELESAIELGANAGVSFPKVLNPFDSLSVGADVLWDVKGAHKGRTIIPSLTYFTPLSRGMAASLSLSAEHADDDFAHYYYSVTPAQSLASGLPVYNAQGGWTSAGATLLTAFDLDGNLLDGGLSAVLVGGYSRMLGDARRTPYTSLRGSADQWFAAVGVGYTF